MPERESKRQPPRFPYVAALLCAACVGAAVWTWMRYSCAWDVPLQELAKGYTDPRVKQRWVGRRARLLVSERGQWVAERSLSEPTPSAPGNRALPVPYYRSERQVFWRAKANGVYSVSVACVTSRAQLPVESAGELEWVTGRIMGAGPEVVLDADASRFTGASIAGLVVGAMGVFVFTVALRHWLKERKAVMLQEPS